MYMYGGNLMDKNCQQLNNKSCEDRNISVDFIN